MTNQLDRNHTQRALALGETYVVEYCSVWEGDSCVGTQIIGAVGPLPLDDIEPPKVWAIGRGLYDWVDAIPAAKFTTDDVDWLQEEEDCGRLLYPYGAR